MNSDWEKRKKYAKNRKLLATSLNAQEQEQFLLKYGDFPNSIQLKEMLLKGNYSITNKIIVPDLPILINNISRIGNNINQIVHLSNSTKQIQNINELTLMLSEIRESIKSFQLNNFKQ